MQHRPRAAAPWRMHPMNDRGCRAARPCEVLGWSRAESAKRVLTGAESGAAAPLSSKLESSISSEEVEVPTPTELVPGEVDERPSRTERVVLGPPWNPGTSTLLTRLESPTRLGFPTLLGSLTRLGSPTLLGSPTHVGSPTHLSGHESEGLFTLGAPTAIVKLCPQSLLGLPSVGLEKRRGTLPQARC